MKSASRTLAMSGVSCLCVAFSTSLLFAQHIHDDHPAAPHGEGNAWIRTELVDGTAQNAVPLVQLTTNQIDVLYSASLVNATCSPKTLSISQTKERTNSATVTWQVGATGSGEWAAGALFVSLKAKVQVDLQRGQGWTDTETLAYTITSSGEAEPCTELSFSSIMTHKAATGTVTSGDHIIHCENSQTNATWTGYCNKVIINGDAVGYSALHMQWSDAPLPQDCGCNEPGPA